MVTDQCTTIGPTLTDAIITLPPGGLSTWRPKAGVYWKAGVDWNDGNPNDIDNFTVGEVWSNPSDQYILPQDIKPLNVHDLECPTWGLGLSTSANGDIITTIGPPWLPLVVPPMEMFTLDPIWASDCTGFWTDPFTLSTFALFDPPVALTPAALLLPTPIARSTPAPAPTPADQTTVLEQATPSAEAAKPASLPNDPAAAPAKTGDPGRENPTPPPVIASADPADSVSMLGGPAASPKNTGNPPSDPPSDPKVPLVAEDPPADSNPASPSVPETPPADSQNPSTDPQVPVDPAPQQEQIPQAPSQGLGAIIYNAFGKSGPEVNGSPILSLSPQSIFTIGAQTFTANPTGFKVSDATISPGGAAQTVDGTKIDLDKAGVLTIDSSTISLKDPSATSILTVADQNFTPNPSAFSIAGTTISAGGSAVTISGTVISLGQWGALAIGSSTIDLSSPSDSYPGKVYTVAGQTFTPNPFAFSIAGTTVYAGGPAVTVDGTIISLGQSGAMAIGSSTVDLPALPYTASRVYKVAGQAFTPNPSAFSIDGTTISAGSPAVTIGGTIISLQPSGTLIVGSSTIPLLISQAKFSSDVNIDGFDVEAQSSFVVVDGVTLSAAAPGVTISGELVSLEAGGATLDIGTGHFALPTPTGTANGSVNVQAFMGGQGKGLEFSLFLVLVVCGTLMLLMGR